MQKPNSIRIQSVLYQLPVGNIEQALTYLNDAARYLHKSDPRQRIEVAYGDCSTSQTLSDDTLLALRAKFQHIADIEYTFFGANLGSARGHNRLLENASAEFTTIFNPDVLIAPNALEELVAALERPGVGIAEARQLPLEHPKNYDATTGETSWASTACAMARTATFKKLNGFDAETFFLYCDDVDFSWRVRLLGKKVVYVWSAVIFHDKRVKHNCGWPSGWAEKYYSAEAGLLLPYKYSRPELADAILAYFRNSGDSELLKAAYEFESRRKSGRLPIPIDPNQEVAQFINGAYAHHRFPVW